MKHPYTADICDLNNNAIVLPFAFRSFGKKQVFSGKLRTLKTFNDNSKVREILSSKGDGHVLLIDGESSMERALVGGNLAALAHENGWEGLVVIGCIRDTHEINDSDIGIKALGTQPRKSKKKGRGMIDVPLVIKGIRVEPGYMIYADLDGVVIVPY